MSDEDFSDASLILIGHGTTLNEESGVPVYQHAAELRKRKLFARVREGFWKQAPGVTEVLAEEGRVDPQAPGRPGRVFIVPLLMSEGYFSENVIPQALGFQKANGRLERIQKRGSQVWFYCKPVGTHVSMTKVLLARAREAVERFPFPRAPDPKDLTLFIAGHGTERDENSRAVIDRQVEHIRAMNLYGGVGAVFLEDEPRIAACYSLAQTKNIVLVPFFMGDGLHVGEDIPVLLGEPERIVQARLAAGQPTWRNPTETQGKRVWYSSSVGTDPAIAEVVLDRVREGARCV